VKSPSTSPTVSTRSKPHVEVDAYLAGLDKKQVELRIKRTELLLAYTEQHPDVVQSIGNSNNCASNVANTCNN